ncbi:MAG: hypothetical protein ABI216_10550 [Devosia sp.]
MKVVATTRPSGNWTAADLLIPAGLLALAFIPIVGGAFRVASLPLL